jgi:hypothetical protein
MIDLASLSSSLLLVREAIRARKEARKKENRMTAASCGGRGRAVENYSYGVKTQLGYVGLKIMSMVIARTK